MKLKAIWNEKTSALGYSADEPNISYSISFLKVMTLKFEKYLELEEASTPISGNAEEPHALWMLRETKFLMIIGKPNSRDDLRLPEYDDDMHGNNIVWQSTEDGDDINWTIILIGYDPEN